MRRLQSWAVLCHQAADFRPLGRVALLALAWVFALVSHSAAAYEGFTIPNSANASFPIQSRFFSQDAQIIADGARGNGVVYAAGACALVQAAVPDMTTRITTGCTIVVNGTTQAVTTGNFTHSAAHATLNRLDIAGSTSAGVKTVTTGTAAASPLPPTIPDNFVVFAFVYVPAADTAITTTQITDKRIFVNTPGAGTGAPTTAGYWTTVADAGLSAEVAMGALATGLVQNTVTTGVPTTIAPTDDNIVVGNGTTWQLKALPTCSGGTDALAYNISTNTFTCNTIATAGTGLSYWTRVAEAGLSAETALGALATGLIINTTTTGVPTILAAQSCTNQFVRSYTASGTATCATVATADLSTTGVGAGTYGQVTVATDGRVTAGSTIADLAHGGTNAATALAARSSSGLNVEGITGHGDSNYTILATDRVVSTNAAFTAPRTWTLFAANASNPGGIVCVVDMQGTVTGTNTLTIARGGADTINGATTFVLASAYATACFWPDGNSKWITQPAPSAGTGDFSSNTSTSVDGEVVLFSGTGGKTGKRATGTGIARLASGVQTAAELSGDGSTSGSNVFTLLNIPTATPMAGSVLATAIAAPGTPAAGKASVYVDSTSKKLCNKDDAGTVTCTQSGAGGGVAVDVQAFSSSGTWTKASGVTAVFVFACGAGGGAGGGQGAAVSAVRSGGAGGGGGFCKGTHYRASTLAATETVTAPAGGAGGAGGTAAAGADGTAGASTSFGSWLVVPGGGGGAGNNAGSAGGGGAGCTGAGVSATGATGVLGGGCLGVAGGAATATSQDGSIGAGSTNTSTPGVLGNNSSLGGASGAGSSSTGVVSTTAGGSSFVSGGGGGAGGGVNAANPGTAQAGTDGGGSSNGVTGAGGGGAGGTAAACGSGGNGVTGAAATSGNGGAGGGGGASINSTTGCTGGNGGIGGGGGGGGGGGTNVGGAGGNGGAGWVVVISW